MKTTQQLSKEYLDAETKLRNKFIKKLEALFDSKKKEAQVCKQAIITLEKQRGEATTEVSNAVQIIRKLKKD